MHAIAVCIFSPGTSIFADLNCIRTTIDRVKSVFSILTLFYSGIRGYNIMYLKQVLEGCVFLRMSARVMGRGLRS